MPSNSLLFVYGGSLKVCLRSACTWCLMPLLSLVYFWSLSAILFFWCYSLFSLKWYFVMVFLMMSDALMFDALMLWCSDALMLWCLMFWCSGIPPITTGCRGKGRVIYVHNSSYNAYQGWIRSRFCQISSRIIKWHRYQDKWADICLIVLLKRGQIAPKGLKVVFFRLKHANLGDRMSTIWIKMIDVSRVWWKTT